LVDHQVHLLEIASLSSLLSLSLSLSLNSIRNSQKQMLFGTFAVVRRPEVMGGAMTTLIGWTDMNLQNGDWRFRLYFEKQSYSTKNRRLRPLSHRVYKEHHFKLNLIEKLSEQLMIVWA
jgi:hypothetical protein